MATLGRFLSSLQQRSSAVHITPPVRNMLRTMGARIGGAGGLMLKAATIPVLTRHVISLLGEKGSDLRSLVHHTVTPTIVRGGAQINVVPEIVTLDLDGRLLPGYEPASLLAEMRAIAPPGVECAVTRFEPGPKTSDLSLFPVLAGILRELDPEGVPIPYLQRAVTDARILARLGIQTYGYLPMRLPEGFSFRKLIHAADERIPVSALEFGTEAITRLLQADRGRGVT